MTMTSARSLLAVLATLAFAFSLGCKQSGTGVSIGGGGGGGGDITSPTVSFTSPTDAATVSGTITITLDASDNVGVTRIELQLDGAALTTISSSPWQHNWDTTGAGNGSHTLRAEAFDAAGNSSVAQVTVTVSNGGGGGDITAPSVALTAPADNATVSGTITITISASDNVGVTSIQVRVDGSLLSTLTSTPWETTFDTTTVGNGSHTISAHAFDAAGNDATDTRTITVSNGGGGGGPVVMAYVETLRSGDTADIPNLDYSAITHVIHGFVNPNADGSLSTAGNFGAYRPTLVPAVHNAGKKIVMSIGGALNSDNFPTIAASQALRTAFANNVVTALNNQGYDGVDIDYEFPDTAQETADFTLLMRDLHTAVKANNPDHIVMFGTGPGWFIDSVNWGQLSQYSDYAFIFGYDWKNPANGPMTNPGTIQWTIGGQQIEASVRGALNLVIGAGYPADKLVMGMPFYTSNGSSWFTMRSAWQQGAPWSPHSDYMEVNMAGDWVTTPECIPLKMSAVLSSGSSVLAGQATIAGVGWWEWGHENPAQDDLTEAVKAWIANN